MTVGLNYLHDKKKVNATSSLFHFVALDIQSFEESSDRINIANQTHNLVYQLNNKPNSKSLPPFTLVINFIVPGSDTLAITCYFQPIAEDWKEKGSGSELLFDFMEADDNFRNNRLNFYLHYIH